MLVKSKNFNHLKVHTILNMRRPIKIDELAEYCKSNKIKSIGLADSYNLWSFRIFRKISKAGTQPIVGTQINISLLKLLAN